MFFFFPKVVLKAICVQMYHIFSACDFGKVVLWNLQSDPRRVKMRLQFPTFFFLPPRICNFRLSSWSPGRIGWLTPSVAVLSLHDAPHFLSAHLFAPCAVVIFATGMSCKTYQQEFQIDKSTPQGSQSFTADTISTEHYMIAKNDFFFFLWNFLFWYDQ